eukprot:12917500-Prorocentrum_lima.AAC.1
MPRNRIPTTTNAETWAAHGNCTGCGQVLRSGEELAAPVLRTTGSTHLINLAIKTPCWIAASWRPHVEGVE